MDDLYKKLRVSVLKLVQDGASFMKLCSAFRGVFWLPFVDDYEAAVFGMINCALGIHRNWPAASVVSNQRSFWSGTKGQKAKLAEQEHQHRSDHETASAS